MPDPKDQTEVLGYVDDWSSKADLYAHIRTKTIEHQLIHGCDTFPTCPAALVFKLRSVDS